MRTVSLGAVTLLAIAGCATQQAPQPLVSSTQGSTLVQTGQVTNVRDVTVSGGHSSGVGALVGGVLGGLAGSTIGGGYGSTAAAVGGTVAGGVAGQKLARAGATTKTTELTVRLSSGEERTYNVDPGESFRIGDTVKITTREGHTRITR